MAARDLLPASAEVTFIPLVVGYVLFTLLLPLGPFIGGVVPLAYLAFCGFFILADSSEVSPRKRTFKKLLFCLALVFPMLTMMAIVSRRE